jgi:hypothetical protein
LANSGIHLDLKQCSLANSYDNILDMVYEYWFQKGSLYFKHGSLM